MDNAIAATTDWTSLDATSSDATAIASRTAQQRGGKAHHVFVASGIAQGVDKVREDHALRTSQRGRQTAFNDPASLAAFDEVGSAPFMFQTHADLAPETLSGGTNRHLPPARTTRHDRHDPHDQRGKPSISVPDTGARRRPSCKASMRRCSSRR